MLEEVKKQQVLGCTLWPVLFCRPQGFHEALCCCQLSLRLFFPSSILLPTCESAYLRGSAGRGTGTQLSVACRWVGCSRFAWNLFRAHRSQNSGLIPCAPYPSPRRTGCICAIGMTPLCLSALTQVNTALQTRFPDILARQRSWCGAAKLRLHAASRRVSSLLM